MHRIFVVLSFIISAVVINGVLVKLPTSAREDTDELTQLAEKFLSLKPVVFQNKGPLVLCQFIDKCCAAEDRFQAISSMVFSIVNEYKSKNRYGKVINKCINSTNLQKASQSCPSLHKLLYPLITKQDRSIIAQYMRRVMIYFTELNKLITNVYEYCNDEEIHALLCLSNTKLVKTCVIKILQAKYDNDGNEVYQKFIVETKQLLMNLNQELFQLVGKNTNTD